MYFVLFHSKNVHLDVDIDIDDVKKVAIAVFAAIALFIWLF